LDIIEPFLTIAGQTAPAGGITLKGTPQGGGQMIRIRAHDVIIRYLTVRSGKYGKSGQGQINLLIDPLPKQGGRYGDIYNVILDHLSLSWTLDENLAIFRNVPEDDPSVWQTYPRVYDISIQHCLIAEGLYPHSTGLQVGGERVLKGGRSIFNGGHGIERIAIHRNLFATNSHRNPALGSKNARVVNNVVYNWTSKASETHDAISVDWIGNYFKPGPLSATDKPIVHNDFFKGSPQFRFERPSIYMHGNLLATPKPVTDWDLYVIHYEDAVIPASYRRSTPLEDAPIPVSVRSAREAYDAVVGDVGANRRITDKGALLESIGQTDARILRHVREGRGGGGLPGMPMPYNSPDEAGGYETISGGTPYRDDDHDGMADEWEKKFGLDPGKLADQAGDLDRDGYTNVEEFLNQTDPSTANR
jgi:hypothetical protein